MTPSLVTETGSHLGFSPTLKFFSRFDALPIVRWFHPPNTTVPFLAFFPSWLSFSRPGFPPPFEVFRLFRVLLRPTRIFELTKTQPSWNFCPMTITSALTPEDTEVIYSLQALSNCYQLLEHLLWHPA
jgi:hypothetical protein